MSTKNSKKKVRPLVIFVDLETNGLPIKKSSGINQYSPYTELDKYDPSRIVGIAWGVYDFFGNQKILRNYLIKPNGFPIENSFIHGITEEVANNDGVDISNAIEQLEKDINNVRVFVAHNVDFDFNILLSEIHRLGNHENLINRLKKMEKSCTGDQTRDLLKIPLKSSYVISKYKMPSLPELYKYCFNKEMTDHHKPDKDVTNLAQCFFHLLKA